jgi:hypothetical protein
MVRYPDRSEWEGKNVKKGVIVWYADGSKTNEDSGAGVYGHGMRLRFSFSL